MLLTSITILSFFIALLPALRNGWYIIHVAIILGVSWLIQDFYKVEVFFERDAVVYFTILHISLINIITYLVYWHDKRSAQKGEWRIPEKTMFSFILIGGTPAAIVAGKILRHKTRKKSFRFGFWFTVCIQIGIIYGMLLYV